MKTLVSIGVFFISGYIVHASILDPVVENVVHLQASHPPTGVPGIWKKKTIWKARWVKEWKSATVVKPVWKKIWSPIEIREWVPIPKPPPNWNDSSSELVTIHEESIPPWTPMPYPDPPPEPYRTIIEETTPVYEHHDINSTEIEGGYSYPPPPPPSPSHLPSHEEVQRIPETTTVRAESNSWRPIYKVDSSDPETLQAKGTSHIHPHPNSLPVLSEFLEPPKLQLNNVMFPQNQFLFNSSKLEPVKTGNQKENVQPYQKEVSPYAVKLAQAIIQEKFNRSKNITGKPIALTEVIFKNSSASPVPSIISTSTVSSLQTTLKGHSTTTENSSKVFIVTPNSRTTS